MNAADEAVEVIKRMARSTYQPGVVHDIGGFGGLFALDKEKYHQPLLVAGADGVGTKLKIAFSTGIHRTVGEDCVAMCVNDILVQGAEPLFFLDYLAMGKMDSDLIQGVIAGVAEGCRKSGCALLGGETAEMPDFYSEGEYELAGFSVGMVEKENLIDGSSIVEGDVIIGVASAGVHSNGFSLVRRILEDRQLSLNAKPPELELSLGEELLRPTIIYVSAVLPLLKTYNIHGMAHITGGGLPGNLSRILPAGTQAVVDPSSWRIPPLFKFLQEQGSVDKEEMFKVFNMGIGYVLVVPPSEAKEIVSELEASAFNSWIIGEVFPLEQDNEPQVNWKREI